MNGIVFTKVASYDYKTADTYPLDDACLFSGHTTPALGFGTA